RAGQHRRRNLPFSLQAKIRTNRNCDPSPIATGQEPSIIGRCIPHDTATFATLHQILNVN
ncbi:MAG: hypothetical protein WBD29_07835, partial [Candidatus Competibacter sp.]